MTFPHQQTYPKKRRTWPYIVGALTLGGCVVGGIAAVAGGNAQPESPGTAVGIAGGKAATSAAPKAKPKSVEVTAGTWSVPGEVKPGTYVTTGVGHCYWARLKDFDGGFESIIANANLDDGERGRLTVKASDKGLELRGDCKWAPAK
jgi:hypothetical protein